MYILSVLIETISKTAVSSTSLFTILLAVLGLYQTATLTKKQNRKLKWQAAKLFLKNRFRPNRDKGSGAVVVMLILLLIGGAAVLWLLWELGGLFALILGIVGLLGMISIFMRIK